MTGRSDTDWMIKRRDSSSTNERRPSDDRRRSSIIAKSLLTPQMAAEEAEKIEHRKAQEKKDKKLLEFLKTLEIESSRDTIEATKRSLQQDATAKDRMAEKRRSTRQDIIRMEMSGNGIMLERLAETFRTLELNSNAHTLDQWCPECACIHTSDVVKEEEDDEEVEED